MHSNATSNISKAIQSISMQIRAIQKGFEAFESKLETIRKRFEAFECKCEPFESDSYYSYANSNHSIGIRIIRTQIRTIRKGFKAI